MKHNASVASNPSWLAISGWVIGLMSFICAVVFYFRPLPQTKELTYSYPYASTKVFDSGAATTYKILDQNNTQIVNDIYITEFAIWNSGDIPIEPSDVRSPLRIILFPAQRILDYSIIAQNRSDVARFVIRELDLRGDPATVSRYEIYTLHTKDKNLINGGVVINRQAALRAGLRPTRRARPWSWRCQRSNW